MSDSENGTVAPDRPPDSDSRAITEDTLAVTPAFGGELHVGQVWRDLVIEEPSTGDSSQGFIAEHRTLMRKVVIRAFPVGVGTEWRRGAWERLAAMPNLQTVRCISAEEEGGWRYEISAVPPSTTLKEWLACNRPGFAEIESLVRQLSATLGALHAQGVVHRRRREGPVWGLLRDG